MRFTVVFMAAAALPAGCEKVDTSKTLVVRGQPGPTYYVHEVTLRDGTRCVVSTSASPEGGTGITCDWGSRGVER